jgi:hypothetical protein
MSDDFSGCCLGRNEEFKEDKYKSPVSEIFRRPVTCRETMKQLYRLRRKSGKFHEITVGKRKDPTKSCV